MSVGFAGWPRRRLLGAAIGAAYGLALALIVFTPITRFLYEVCADLGSWWTHSVDMPGHPTPNSVGFVLNMILFAPFGMLLVVLWRRSWVSATAICFLVSACIETIQLIPELHRYSSISDVMANGSGGLVGALGAVVLLRSVPRLSGRAGIPSHPA